MGGAFRQQHDFKRLGAESIKFIQNLNIYQTYVLEAATKHQV